MNVKQGIREGIQNNRPRGYYERRETCSFCLEVKYINMTEKAREGVLSRHRLAGEKEDMLLCLGGNYCTHSRVYRPLIGGRGMGRGGHSARPQGMPWCQELEDSGEEEDVLELWHSQRGGTR